MSINWTQAEERGQVKVLDFGLAKRLPTDADWHGVTLDLQQTQEGQVLGSPSYMSPEQALAKDLDHRSDIFSMAVVLYELVIPKHPHMIHHRPPARLPGLSA